MLNDFEVYLDHFHNRWSTKDIENISLNQYVGIKNKDTFCQWVETKTKILGNIKGQPSIKFGIYEREDKEKKPKNYNNDEIHSWGKIFGNNKINAFNEIKKNIINVIKFSLAGKFKEIDDIKLNPLFKWKIAFLYSNERLIPIYSRSILNEIAIHFKYPVDKKTSISDIQNLMILNKPVDLNVYEFMEYLYNKFGNKKSNNNSPKTNIPTKKNKRKGVNSKNTESQSRTGSRSYVATQIHNKIQLVLQKKLIIEYGKESVILEENHVDIKVKQPRFVLFYEVKSSPYASKCVREALGQILMYIFMDDDKREKKLYVVGQYPPNNNEIKYIDFIKNKLNIDFNYININLD